ncbi:MAG: 8-oxo-dGTP diphosphatase [Saprospiraceae bacterium]|jgi:8-oxo-dGTP diphosphatase
MTDYSDKNEDASTLNSPIDTDFKAAISVDCVIFGYDKYDLKVLVLKSDMPIFKGQYSLLGDLLRHDENTDQSAKRVLQKHTGLTDLFMEQVSTFSDVERHPLGRVVTIAYYSLVQLNENLMNLSTHNADLKWKKVSDIEELAFDHKLIFDKCLKQLRYGLKEKPIGFNLLPEKFTLKQLQNLYEKVLDLEIDKRNFRRKLKSIDLLVDVNENQTDVNHRPAKLYSFDKRKYDTKKKKGFNFEL